MITIIQALILGIVQGVTEWLPVSSSGHLVLIQQWFGIEAPLVFDIWLHLGTLFVVSIVFWKDLVKVFKAFFTGNFKSFHGKMSLYLILGTAATIFVALVFENLFESFYSSTLVVGIALLVTAGLLFLSGLVKEKKHLNHNQAFFIGLVQGLAIIPGISRSGSTISVGLLSGIKREEIVKFSFLLSIPAIIGAFVYKLGDWGASGMDSWAISLGLMTSIVVGYFSLKWLIKLIYSGKFKYFGWYCLVLGIIVIITSLV
jgi:undecaprenyl-diphosphatase